MNKIDIKHIIKMAALTVLAIFPFFAFASSKEDLRECICIDKNWQFSFGNASSPQADFGCGTEYFNYLTKAASIHNAGPYSPKFDASAWRTIDLPHDWVTELPYDSLASHSHGYKTVGYKYPETSVGWYRKTFSIPASDKGRHISLRFDGIFRDARVWVNGFYLGHEPSGYAYQTYDISAYLNYGGENLICVRADATLEEGWFYEGAGIYRHVWLEKTKPVHIAPYGTFIRSIFPEDGSLDNVVLDISATVDNKGLNTADISLKHIVEGPDGEIIAECSAGDAVILPKASSTISTQINIPQPHLWSCEHPDLYKVVTQVRSEGRVIDVYETVSGIRKVEFDANKGFILNGKQVKIKGVNMHQDHSGVGAAIPDELQEWRLLQLKKFGCNAYKASHNPMTPQMLDACDRLGILVIEENRLTGVNEEHIRLLEKMIRRDRNHPCVILWSVGNEEWGIEWNEWGTNIAASMREYCHRFDPSRLMTVASSGGPAPLVGADVAGYNYILQNPVEKHRGDYPSRCAVGSEETSGCGTRGVYFDDVENGRMASLNRSPNGPDSLYNCIERGWKFYYDRPWLGGLFYWTGFDYRGEPNPLKFPAVGSEFGILDYCGFPKDEAWYLKAWWTEETVLHILPHWNLKGHEGEIVPVWVYSNCDEVELTVNGKRLGRKKMPFNGHLEWEATYKGGSIIATGYRKGRKVVQERIETTGDAVRADATIEFKGASGEWGNRSIENFTAVPEKLPVVSGQIAIVNISMKDSKGRFVPDSCGEVCISVPNTWTILGSGNGDPACQAPDHTYEVAVPVMDYGNDTRPGIASRQISIPVFNGHAQLLLQLR